MASASNKPKTPKHVPIEVGAVFYTDGSASPNPGYAGWGIHGYTYDNTQPVTIPSTQKKNIITNKGYKDAKELSTEIAPVKLVAKFNGYGTSPYPAPTNNNRMELLALAKAFDMAMDKPWKEMTLYSDSEYAINAVGHWYDKWSKNGWRNSKGEPVKEKDSIMATYEKCQLVKAKMSFDIKHIKAHVGHLGNETADKLAKKGTTLHQYGKEYEEMKTELRGEPKPKVDYHHFFTKNRWYFFGGEEYQTPRLHDYYLYSVGVMGKGKHDKDFGMHAADGFSSIILLKEPEPVIEHVQAKYNEICNTDYSYVIAGRLDTLLTPDSYNDIMSENMAEFTCHDKFDKTLLLPSGKVICSEFNPVHLSYLQMTRYPNLYRFAEHALGHTDPEICETDITSLLVETTTDKKGKVSYKLNSTIPGNNGIKTQVSCLDPMTGELHQLEVHLTTKVDLPDKNHLAKMVKSFPGQLTVKVYTLRYADDCYKYVICVSLIDLSAIGIWTNFDSSFVYLRPTTTPR